MNSVKTPGLKTQEELSSPGRPFMTIKRADALTGILFVLPALLFIAIFILIPLVTTLGLGFFSHDLMKPQKGTVFVGLGNYIYLVRYGILQSVLSHSVIITASAVAIQMVLAMIIALLLNRAFTGRGVARAAFIIPWALPTIAAAFVIRWMFDTNFGVVNQILIEIGLIEKGIPWFGKPSTAVLGVIMAHVWKGLPYPILVFLAGLQLISQDVLDASKVDGVSPWQEFWYITLPHLKYVVAITVVLRTIWFFNWFDFLYLLTSGGPANATMTLPVQTYITAFRTFKMGRASALATVMAVTLLVFTIVFLRLVLKEDEEL